MNNWWFTSYQLRNENAELRADNARLIADLTGEGFTLEKLQREIEELKAELLSNETLRVRLTQELNAVRSALEDGANEREKLKDDFENLKRDRDEYAAQHAIEERRAAGWRFKFHSLKEQVETALRIED